MTPAVDDATGRVAELTAALAGLRARVARAAESAGRPLEDIELLPVTKFFPASDVAILWRLGCRAFGESRAQEAAAKIAEFDLLVFLFQRRGKAVSRETLLSQVWKVGPNVASERSAMPFGACAR